MSCAIQTDRDRKRGTGRGGRDSRLFRESCLWQSGLESTSTKTLVCLVLLVVATDEPWAVSQSGMVTNWEERPHGSLSLEWKSGQRKEVFSQ